MSNISTVYKVVHSGMEGYSSYAYHLLPRKLIVRYKIGEKVFPPIGKLFAYNSEFGVIVNHPWLRRNGTGVRKNTLMVLECEAVISHHRDYMSDYFNFTAIKAFWSTELTDYKYLIRVPMTTVFCDWIRPIRELSEIDIEGIQY